MRVDREEMQPEPLSLEARHSFFLQLATLFASGCSLSQSLEAVGQSDKPGELQRVALSVLLKLERGSRLSSALASEQGHFTTEEVSLVRLGEETGKLHVVLLRLSKNLEQAIANRRQFIQAGLYPLAILLFSFSLVGMMAFVLLPKLHPIFEGFQLDLPWPTRLVLWASNLVPWMVLLAICIAFAGLIAARKNPHWHRLLYSFPLLASILRQRTLGELSASLSILVSAGARLDHCFLLLADQAADPAIRLALTRVRTTLRNGYSLTEALEAEEAIPHLWKQLLVVGSETGRIDFFSQRLAEIYIEDFRWKLGQAVALMEPVLLMSVGGLVGFLLLACFLPFYQLVTVVI